MINLIKIYFSANQWSCVLRLIHLQTNYCEIFENYRLKPFIFFIKFSTKQVILKIKEEITEESRP